MSSTFSLESHYHFSPDSFNYEFEQNSSQAITPKNKYKKRSINPTEAKNIPKNLGALLRNYIVRVYPELTKNKAIKKFIIVGQTRKNFTRQDLIELFSDPVAQTLAREYFTGFEIIKDLVLSEKIPDTTVCLKYIKKMFIGTYFPESLTNLKLPDPDSRHFELDVTISNY